MNTLQKDVSGMEPIFHLIAVVWQPTAMAIGLVFAYGLISRSRLSHRHTTVITGLMFGVAALLSMMFPITLGEGVIVDLRTVFVGMGAAFFGPVAGLISLAIAGAARIAIGGVGAVPGLIGLGLVTVMALGWRQWVRPRVQSDTLALTVLGLLLCSNQVVVFMLPAPMQQMFWEEIAPWFSLSHIIGALLLGKMILRELTLTVELNELRNAVRRDPLTNLINREALISAYEKGLSPKMQSDGTAMLCIDVDNFKQINDTYGHLAGDQVLVEIAGRMCDCLRPEDIFARVSGDEFIIVLNNLSDENAQSVANRCQEVIEQRPVTANTGTIGVSVSIGCTWTAVRPAFVELRLAADAALYRAKDRGRNCVAFERLKGVVDGIGASSQPVAG